MTCTFPEVIFLCQLFALPNAFPFLAFYLSSCMALSQTFFMLLYSHFFNSCNRWPHMYCFYLSIAFCIFCPVCMFFNNIFCHLLFQNFSCLLSYSCSSFYLNALSLCLHFVFINIPLLVIVNYAKSLHVAWHSLHAQLSDIFHLLIIFFK
jgi:hypothetical protein